MNEYLFPIKIALFTFPIAAFFLTLPFLIIQYRKYGYVNKYRAFILYSLLLYAMSAYYLVILPLPANVNNCTTREALTHYMQLRPFTFISDTLKETRVVWSEPASFMHLFKERAFLQALFNIFLTIPAGVYLRYYFRKGLGATLLFSLGLSLFFELTQLTGLYGIYQCPYRLFDVDDLMLNTLGGIIGYWITPILAAFLPKTENLDKDVELDKMTVGFIRRGIAYIFDNIIIGIATSILSMIVSASSAVVLQTTDIGSLEKSFINAFSFVIVIMIYFMVIPTVTGGRTLGKWITRIHVIADRREGELQEITFMDLVKRYALLYYGVYGLFSLMAWVANYGELPAYADVALLLVRAVFVFVLGAYFVIQLFRGNKILFYERVSGTRNVITLREEMEDHQGTSS
ncbi:VanZ family protein [Paenibacillus aquistagni]|uniref:Glycopeptide antibiotics resistance protein n=1 Tax=Paenibacillus aquistagni TaxID=1852522 RepID=A0A1X7JIZ8_9BACL|nr:VanZ family protein [Paenibacillus aquistagni]SMG27829.1 Glycopeptide antibiotics resistance protein [Paenibacillus aquistagni]